MKSHDNFHTTHEAYGVMLEEVEETEEELEEIKYRLEKLWASVKTDNIEGVCEIAEQIERHSMLLIAEAIQVAAMCKKTMDCFPKAELPPMEVACISKMCCEYCRFFSGYSIHKELENYCIKKCQKVLTSGYCSDFYPTVKTVTKSKGETK